MAKVGVFKLSSCSGCQLQLLGLGPELARVEDLELAPFPEATSRAYDGPLDLALVEGSVSTPAQLDEVRAIRARALEVVAIGACAVSGGVQALRNQRFGPAWCERAYPHPELLEVLDRSTPLSAHVSVDAETSGYPVDEDALRRALSALLRGEKPRQVSTPVCVECKRAGVTCLLVTGLSACAGPTSRGGCGAVCPRQGRGCFACFGPLPRAPDEAPDEADAPASRALIAPPSTGLFHARGRDPEANDA